MLKLQLWYHIVGFDKIYHMVWKTKKRSCDLCSVDDDILSVWLRFFTKKLPVTVFGARADNW